MSELEQELHALGAELAFPPVPDLAADVGQRLRTRVARPSRFRLLAAAAAALVLAAAAALAVPPARSAILDFLGIGGATIERTNTQPRAPSDADLALGPRVTLVEAHRLADFPIRRPAAAARVYLDGSVPGGKVSFVWNVGGRRLLLTEFRGAQVPYVRKLVGPRTRIVEVLVDGAEGAWIVGAAHEIVWRDAHGLIRPDTRRLAGNVLLWDRGGVTFRLEGARTRGEALAIATGLRGTPRRPAV